jgi:hypothetical protein
MIEHATKAKLEAIFQSTSNQEVVYVPLYLAKGEFHERHYYIHPADIKLDAFRSMIATNDRLRIFIPSDVDQLFPILKEIDTFDNCFFANSSTFWELDDLKENEYGAIAVNSKFDVYKIIFKRYSNYQAYFIKSAFYKFNLYMDKPYIMKLLSFNDKCLEPARKRITAFKNPEVFDKLKQNFSEITYFEV